MKYSAQILIKTKHITRERFTDDETLVNFFKELLWKGRERVLEETFAAQEVLKKFSAAFRDSGIDNLVRLSHDDTDFYLDKDNIPNDLPCMIDKFAEVLHNAFERFYEEITVIMDAKWEHIDFYIELNLLRIHSIGVYPIQITVKGLPESSNVPRIEDNFNLFVTRLASNIEKYIELEDITISFSKKRSKAVGKENAREKKKEIKDNECHLFPLYGVMLGETPVVKLAKLGVPANDLDENKKPYKYYRVKDARFWHNGKRATHMYMTYTDPMPPQWTECGFDWDLSYNQWMELFKKLDFHISIVKKPKKGWYSGKKTLIAQFNASKKFSDKMLLNFEVYFNYSQKTSLRAQGTIYSLRVRAT